MKKSALLIFPVLILLGMGSCRKKHEVNKVPVVDAGPALFVQLPADTVTLNGSATDEDGRIMGYLWSKISGPNTPYFHTPGLPVTKVSGLVTGAYRFQLWAVDDDGDTGMDTVSVIVSSSPVITLNIQPGTEGQDALVLYKEGDNGPSGAANLNFGAHHELNYSRWTYSGQGFGEGSMRSYLKFPVLATIPANATILSAKLSLYGVTTSAFTPQGNSHYPGSPYSSDSLAVKGWVKRVTGSWDENSVTWNNKPGTVDANQVEIPGSTSQWNFNATNLDVTQLVKDMRTAGSNDGFCLQLQTEQIYRNMIFSSSEAADAAKRPLLVVQYRVQ